MTSFKKGTQITFREKQASLVFPEKVVKGAAKYFTTAYGSKMEVPNQFFFISYLACLGSMLANKIRLKSVLDTQPRLYAVIVAESASDKKSTAIKYSVRHFKEVFGDEFNVSFGLGSAEGLQRVFKKSAKSSKDKASSKALLAFDEFKAFINKCGIKNSILLECINSLFEINYYENHTKTTSFILENAFLSLIGASTIQTYERMYSSAFTTIGFPNRIFLVVGTADKSFSLPGEVSEKKIKVMHENLRLIYDKYKDGYIFEMTDDGWQYYDAWYHQIDRKSVHSKRIDGYCLRLAMLLAMNQLKPYIDINTVKDAIALCNWQMEVRKVYDPIDADSNIAAMEEKIRRVLKSKGPLKDYQLKQFTNVKRVGLWIYENARENLKRGEEIGFSGKAKTWFIVEDK